MSAGLGKKCSSARQHTARERAAVVAGGPPVNGCHFWLQERKRAEQKGDWGGINKFLNRLLVCSCHFSRVHVGSWHARV